MGVIMEQNQVNSNIIFGRNAVFEAVRSNREIDRLLVAHQNTLGSVAAIIAKCKEKGILIKEVPSSKLDFLCNNQNHQGVAAIIANFEYCSVQDILDAAKEKNHNPFIIICDEIEDPHNLGAIVRSAEAAGADGIIIPKRRAASVNATVAKSASGALEYMKIARVTNLVNEMEYLKKQGIWIFGADMGEPNWTKTDFTGPVAIVIGNEGKGIGRLVLEHCDQVVSLPMLGEINSLNASVAAGVLMYEVVRQRTLK